MILKDNNTGKCITNVSPYHCKSTYFYIGFGPCSNRLDAFDIHGLKMLKNFRLLYLSN